MKKINTPFMVMLFALVILGIVACKTMMNNNNAGNELADLRPDNISAIKIQPAINPGFFDIALDYDEETRLINVLNEGVVLQGPKPDQVVTTETILSLTNGKQIIIGDSGEAEFLVTSNAQTNPHSYMIASSDLKEFLLPYQELFKREISLKKNIALYGTTRITGYVLEDTSARREAAASSQEVFTLKKGNLVRTLAKVTTDGVEWTFVDTVALSLPNPVGWIESAKFTNQPPPFIPNEGFLLQEVALYAEPSSSAPVLQKSSGQVAISKRANDMAYCTLPGGVDGWVKETDISYTFPANYDMGY